MHQEREVHIEHIKPTQSTIIVDGALVRINYAGNSATDRMDTIGKILLQSAGKRDIQAQNQ
mgnify:CR=1 FL=1